MKQVTLSRRQAFWIWCVVLILALVVPLYVPAAETPKEKIAFAYAAISPTMSGIWMAKEMGAFDRQGLSVELVHISSGAVSIQALVGAAFTRPWALATRWWQRSSRAADHCRRQQHQPPRNAVVGAAGDSTGRAATGKDLSHHSVRLHE